MFDINIYYYTEGLNSGVQEIRLINSTSYSSSSWKDYKSIGNDKIGKEITKFSAEKKSEIQVFVVLKPGYDINNVKVKPNGVDSTALAPSQSFKDSDDDSWVFAYTVAKQLKDDLWIMFEGKPALRTQTVTLSQTNADYFNKVDPNRGECDPASVFLADATFTLSYKVWGSGYQEIFANLTLAEFKAKFESNFSFTLPASATLSLKATTGDAAKTTGGHPQVFDLSSVGLFEFDNTSQSLTDYSSTLSLQVFSNKAMIINWKEVTSSSLLSGVSAHVSASFRSNIYVKDITALNGNSYWNNDTPFSFSEYNNCKNQGYYVKFDITPTDYKILTDPSTRFILGSGNHFSSAEVIESGMLKFNDATNPTEAWINPKGIDITDYGTLWIYIEYYKEDVAQNANFQELKFKVSTGNNNSSPYKFAQFGCNYSDIDADLIYVESFGRPEEYIHDYTYPENYSCYYLKGSKITINHLVVGYTSDKSDITDLRELSLGQTITINFKTTNGIQTLTATFAEYEEECYYWKFANLPAWLTNEGGDYYDQFFPFTIDTEALKTATGGDLCEIEVVVSDRVA